jgi:hypothetical protein
MASHVGEQQLCECGCGTPGSHWDLESYFDASYEEYTAWEREQEARHCLRSADVLNSLAEAEDEDDPLAAIMTKAARGAREKAQELLAQAASHRERSERYFKRFEREWVVLRARLAQTSGPAGWSLDRPRTTSRRRAVRTRSRTRRARSPGRSTGDSDPEPDPLTPARFGGGVSVVRVAA